MVELIDKKTGNVKLRTKKKNRISDIVKASSLASMASGAGLLTVSRIDKGSSVYANVPSANAALHLLSENIDLTQEPGIMPMNIYSKSTDSEQMFVCGYLGTETVENVATILPTETKCVLKPDLSNPTVDVTYTKNTGAFALKSLVIGKDYNAAVATTGVYAVGVRDPSFPVGIAGYAHSFALEHTSNGTVIHKGASPTVGVSYNFKTKENAPFENVIMSGNFMASATTWKAVSSGLIVNNCLMKITSCTVASQTITITLSYVKNWRSNSTIETIPFQVTNTCPTIFTNIHPVLVNAPGSDIVDIYTTLGYDSLSALCTVQKSTIDFTDPDSPVVTEDDLTFDTPFGINGFTNTFTPNNFDPALGIEFTDQFGDLCVALPRRGAISPTTKTYVDWCVVLWQEYVVLKKSDFSYKRTIIGTRNVANETTVLVNTDVPNTPLPFIVNTSATAGGNAYLNVTEFISGVNFDTPITKTEDDILKIVYSYKFAPNT